MRGADVAFALAAALHVVLVGAWVVDDAAIAWSYARNWADGHGLVAWPGGERVEGYTDFLWVALLAAGERAGIGAWATGKALGIACTVLAVPLVRRLAAELCPARPVVAGLAASALFAADTQVAVFGACGLENPLFTLLLAAGLLGALRETRGAPGTWSAVAWLGLALTRAEGVVYVAVAGLAIAAASGPSRAARWLAPFAAPFAAYQAWHLAWFAWPLPMTAYAKLSDQGAGALVDPSSRGWRYVLDALSEPTELAGVACGLGAVVLARGRLRAELAAVAAIGGLPWAFAVVAGGDWMEHGRWISLGAAPAAALAGVGLAGLCDRLGRAGPAAIALACGLFAWRDASRTLGYARDPNLGVAHVIARSAHEEETWRALHVDDRLRIELVDIGGALWASGAEVVDWAGLTDVTAARQTAHRGALLANGLALQGRPHLVRLSTDEIGRMLRRKPIQRRYAPIGREVLLRRDLVLAEAWTGPGPQVDLGPVVVHGWDAPGTAVFEAAYVEVGLSTPVAAPFSARMVLADLAGEAVASWPLPLGPVPPTAWRADEVRVVRAQLALPPALPRGRWRLGLRISLDGAPLGDEPLWGGVELEVVGEAEAMAAAEASIAALDCATAERAWFLARRRAIDRTRLDATHGPRVRAVLAGCLAAGRATVEALARARALDPDAPGVADAVGVRVGALQGECDAHAAAGSWAACAAACDDVMRLAPDRVWTRRTAERCRTRAFEAFEAGTDGP